MVFFLAMAPIGGSAHRRHVLVPCPPRRGPRELFTSFVNRTLHEHIWSLLPPHPTPENADRPLIIVTITSARGGRALQLLRLAHCVRMLGTEPNVHWVVVEDAAAPSPQVAELLGSSSFSHRHLAYGPTHQGGNAQRNLAFRTIRDSQLQGVVYNLDDDNAIHPALWNELRRVGRGSIGILPTRVRRFDRTPASICRPGEMVQQTLDPTRWLVERPIYDRAGHFRRFAAGWCEERSSPMVQLLGRRRFCVDMGGFAFDSALLNSLRGGPLWNYTGRGGESEFIQALLPGSGPEALQPLAHCCTTLLVYHNDYRHEVPPTDPISLVPPGSKLPTSCGTLALWPSPRTSITHRHHRRTAQPHAPTHTPTDRALSTTSREARSRSLASRALHSRRMHHTYHRATATAHTRQAAVHRRWHHRWPPAAAWA